LLNRLNAEFRHREFKRVIEIPVLTESVFSSSAMVAPVARVAALMSFAVNEKISGNLMQNAGAYE
jgi:7-keto-8-aminopelargonate synthetase-like enzyme